MRASEIIFISLLVSADESFKHLVLTQCNHHNGCESEILEDKVALELMWSRDMELCKSVSLSNILKRLGYIASVCFHQVELEYDHPNYVSKAKKSLKLIASALQGALGCIVEITICYSNYTKIKKSSYKLLTGARGTKRPNKNVIESSERFSDVSEAGPVVCTLVRKLQQ